MDGQACAGSAVRRLLFTLVCSALVLIPTLLPAQSAPEDYQETTPIQWHVHEIRAASELMLADFRLPEWYGSTWPDSVRVRVGIDSATGDTLAIRYEDWSTRLKGLPVAEVKR